MKFNDLRQRAAESNIQLTEAEILELLHEFETFQSEFEIQKKELLLAKEKVLSELAFRNSIESSLSSGIAIVDDEGRQTYVNPSFCKLFGWSAKELTGKTTPYVYWPVDQLQAIGEAFQLTLANKAPKEGFELIFETKGGVRIPVQVIITPFYDGKQRIGWLANVIDITERKRAEDALIRSRQLLSEAEKIGKVGGWEFDIDTMEQTWTEEVYKLHEISQLFNPDVEKGIDFYTPESRPIIEKAVQRAIEFGEPFDLELEIITANKNLRNVHAIGKADLKHRKVYGFFQDITGRKKAEEEIMLKNAELLKLNATKDKFFSIIAHDLRSPFNSILGFSELLLDQISQKNYEGTENYAQIIKKSSGQAMKLLMNLMDWSRSQTGRMALNPEYFDLVDLINETTLLSFEIFQQKELSIKKKLPESAMVYADKNMISTVLRNLFSNAAKFSHPGGSVTISVKKQPNELTISLSDTGIGIEESRLDNLFLIGESYSTKGTQNEKGTGLGLILCKEFVDRNEGENWIESEVGKGSTFYFTLPRQEKSNVNHLFKYATLIPAAEKWMNKLKILIVEDDETSERLLAIQVNHFGKEVIEAVTGIEAVDICRQNPDIDLILMDIQLPEMDGYEATRQIREFNQDVIIIALTAYGFDGDRVKAINAGCNDYGVKPISKSQLIKIIQKNFKNKSHN